jgi:hypothetical protein
MFLTDPIALTFSAVLPSAAPPAAIWRALEAAPRWPEVRPDIAEARIVPHGRLEPGATIRTFVKPGSKIPDMVYRVLAAEPLRRMVWASRVPTQLFMIEITIAEAADGARVTAMVSVEADGFVNRLSLLVFRKRHVATLTKQLVERLGPLLTLAERM